MWRRAKPAKRTTSMLRSRAVPTVFTPVEQSYQCLAEELQRSPLTVEVQLQQLEKEVNAPDARLFVQSLLAWVRYKAGDWNAFLFQSKQVLAQYETINDKPRPPRFCAFDVQSRRSPKWAKLWQKNALVAENPDLDLRFDAPLQQPVERRIFVDTPTSTLLQVTIEGDTKRVSARLEESPWAPELEEVRHQQIVVVTIAPGQPQATAVINVAAVGHTGNSLRLPVTVSEAQTGGDNDEPQKQAG